MAQKKKKGPPPRTKEVPKRKISASNIFLAFIGILMILALFASALQ